MIRRIAVVLNVLCVGLVFSGISLAGTLTISGGNIYFQKNADTVELWNLSVDQEGYLLPDGAYKYEFREMPKIDREALAEVERAGDDRRLEEIARAEEKQMYLLTGSFEIIDGVVVLPEGNIAEKTAWESSDLGTVNRLP